MKVSKGLIFLTCFLCFSTGLAQKQEPLYSLFLIGDVGSPELNGQDQVLNLLEEKLAEANNEASGVIFLGDNIYPRGLPPKGDKLRNQSEKRLQATLAALEEYHGDIFFIAGNHDWNHGKKDGLAYVKRQEKYIEAFLNHNAIFMPGEGCPGPVEINLTEEITLAAFDSQWLIQPWHKGNGQDCETEDFNDLLFALEDILNRNSHKRLVVASHHPIFSYGPHGGVFPFKSHIFPLADSHLDLPIPLPIIGSMYVFFRKYLGHVQDTSHPNYAFIRKHLKQLFDNYPNLVHVSGHDHSLQYIRRDSVHYIVSGSGSELTYVKKKKHARFAALEKGFCELEFYEDGATRLKVWTTSGLLYEDSLFKKPFTLPQEKSWFNSHVNFSDSVIAVAPGKKYEGSGLKKTLMGENYRKAWSTPVNVQVFDISKVQGGLTPVAREAGMAVQLLHLKDSSGRQFTLRPVDKNAAQTLPPELNGTFAADLAQDQVSASHPYAALVIPKLAQAAGIYHTNPELVYIPDDPRLDQFRKEFANTLAFFEERPYGNAWQRYAPFGGADTIVDHPTALKSLTCHNDFQADQQFIIRNRLFDLLIGDWDNGEAQWRWAQFDTDSGRLLRPIPVDRDRAFFVNEGIIPKIASRKWALPELEGFGKQVRSVGGFVYSGRHFDHFFLNEPSLDDWTREARRLQQQLTDSVIEEAVRMWPEEIFELTRESIIAALKSRRDQLTTYASSYYLNLAKTVNVRGSHEAERIEAARLNNRETQVTVYPVGSEKPIYDRIFYTDETREIRIYALAGRDSVIISGEVDKGIRLRIIGGRGEDYIMDSSKVGGLTKKTRVYDKKKENNVVLGGSETKSFISNRSNVHDFIPEGMKYPLALPLIFGDYNSDDGLFIGAGALITTYGFQKEPFATRHLATGKIAPLTQSTEIRYRGELVDLIGRTDVRLDALIRAPNFTGNFYGLGNETVNRSGIRIDEVERKHYRIESQRLFFDALLKTRIGESGEFYLGPLYSEFALQEPAEEGQFISDFKNNGLNPAGLYQRKKYAGARIILESDTRDHSFFPLRGMQFLVDGVFAEPLQGTSGTMTRVQAEAAVYHSFSTPARLTLSARIGGGAIFGDYDFFQANSLGGTENLRGFRKNRFLGRYSFYNNAEVRLLLFRFKSYLAPGSFGLLAFHDAGRVWIEDESSSKWHRGYGGGLWLAPFDELAGTLYLGFSEEEAFLALLRIGFFF